VGANAVEPPRKQHAKGLMGKAAFERIANEIMAIAARKRFHQHLGGAREHRGMPLEGQPITHLVGEQCLFGGVCQHLADTSGKKGRKRKFAAEIGRDRRL